MIHVKVFIFNPVQENTYVLFNNEKECAIVDPGCYFPEEAEQLQTFIKGEKLIPKMLLNTHCHLDHVFGNKYIAETYNLVAQIHEKEKAVLAFAPASGLMYDMPFDNYSGDFIFLKEGDAIKIGEDELTVIEAPGHS